jgi:hypothetical protein
MYETKLKAAIQAIIIIIQSEQLSSQVSKPSQILLLDVMAGLT